MPLNLSFNFLHSEPRLRVAILFLVVAAAVTLLYDVRTSALTQPQTSAVEASVSGENAAAAAAPVSSSPTQEVTIANNGLALVQGAQAVSVSSDSLTAQISWGSEQFDWNVRFSSATKFIDQTGELGSISAIQPGDTVTITGQLDTSSSQPTIDAQYVRY